MDKLILLLLFVFYKLDIYAQTYPNHYGIGNDVGISVSSSPTQNGDSIQTTLNGTGYYTDLAGYYRFMAQAGFGATDEDIDSLQHKGIENWIEWQMTMPYTTYSQIYDTIYNEAIALIDVCGPTNTSVLANYSWRKRPAYLNMAFWEKALREQDVLRQKAAFALSQIFVVAPKGGTQYIGYKGGGFATYYDYLYEGAFGNFRDLLTNITLSPVMADYLTYMCNRKENPNTGTLPDENYAREIMQLFTIGLVELNNDGTSKLDINGNTIPTYTNQDIKELAKVFTGTCGVEIDSMCIWYGDYSYYFGKHSRAYKWENPMIVFQEHHDTGIKVLPDATVIPAGQTGMQDINDALDWLFNHPNVGPFISYRLIQQLVKSNPTPEYVNRVASAFNNNGNDVRGDMGAVFKAVLLDPEARDCEWINHPSSGKLLQPLERYLNVFKAFDIDSPSGLLRFIDTDANLGEEKYIHQGFLSAPSVFNFFTPDHTEGEIEEEGLVAPEFQILNDVTAIHYLNRIEATLKRMAAWAHPKPFVNFTDASISTSLGHCDVSQNYYDSPFLDFSDEINLCETENFSVLVDYLDLHLCRGQLNENVRDHIIQYLIGLDAQGKGCSGALGVTTIVNDAIFLIMLSPSYAILK